MKIIRLAINETFYFFKSETRIFSILMLGLLTASFSFLFLSAFTINLQENHEKVFGYKNKVYTIEFNPKGITQEQLLPVLNSDIKATIQSIDFFTNFAELNKHYTVIGSQMDKNEFYLLEGATFKGIEKSTLQNSIILSKDMIEYSKQLSPIGETFLFNHKQYNIVGVIAGVPKNTIILYNSEFLGQKFKINRVKITYNNRPIKSEVEKLSIKLKTFDLSSRLIEPPIVDPSSRAAFIQKLIIYALIILIAILNIMTLLSYWLKRNLKLYMVFNLCGSTFGKTFSIILINVVINSTVSFLLGLTLYTLALPFLGVLGIGYGLLWNEIITIFFVYTLFVMSSILPTVIKVSKTNLVNSYKWGTDD